MEMIGKRLPYLAKYKVVADKNSGKFLSVFMKIYCDAGAAFSEMTSGIAAYFAQNCYNSRRWRIIPSAVLTNTPVNAYCRAPGSTQGVAIIETVMDHLSNATGIDPLQIRRANFLTIGDPLLDKTYLKDSNPLDIMIGKMLESSNYTGRKKEIENFNKANKWVKEGISFNPTKYSYDYSPDARFDAYIAVYSTDGSVLVTVGGIEMGQGLNTKVIQVIAKELNIPAALNACRKLMERMKPVKEEMENPSDWEELVKRCFAKNIDLTVRHMGNPTNDKIKSYNIWSLAVSEVKVDILTGETCILRADLAQDTGTSLNPDIDVGQIEGKIMTNSTWNYKPPLSKDIPQDLRTSFYNGKRHDLGVFWIQGHGSMTLDKHDWIVLNAPATPENIVFEKLEMDSHLLFNGEMLEQKKACPRKFTLESPNNDFHPELMESLKKGVNMGFVY
ncbi:XDH [Lepeophtheirus salmonis]|uniref:XDH n=1 Tax=Lepeophtheirus salmonis TaxID=72036 RepID=A0A7R8H423_LEPSM|nr:XDH [Lepeophtheirus salmonis]CAF2852093.1 XDH [Lepeophtheirus salmonis]